MYQINLLTRNRICLQTPIPIPTPQPGEFFEKTLRIFRQSYLMEQSQMAELVERALSNLEILGSSPA